MFKRSDWIVGVFSILLGVFILVVSTTWHELNSMDFAGPEGVPRILAWGILIIGIIHVVGAYLSPKLSSDHKNQWVKELYEAKPIIQITLVSAIYILLFEYLGYLIATPLLIIGIMMVVKVRDIKSLLITSLSTTTILYLIFGIALKVKLPLGFIEVFFN